MRAPLLALMLSAGQAAWPCDLTGAWYDNSGNLATIAQNSTGGLLVTAVSPTSWQTATGGLTGNGTTLELSFGGASPMDAVVSPTCWTLRFANMQQWQRGETFDNIVSLAAGAWAQKHLASGSIKELTYRAPLAIRRRLFTWCTWST